VPISALRTGSFALPWGSSIFAKVIAFNLYGNSLESDAGNGAVILTNPDTPVSIQEHVAARSASTIGLEFSDGASNGGAPILDYRVTYTTDSQFDSTTHVEVAASSPWVAENLYVGSTYSFTIEARNEYGYSTPSNSIDIYCAFVPSQIQNVQTIEDGPDA
jgi:hypothetical protein